MIRNIFWDLDGTLFDTYPAITYTFSKSMNELGFPVALNVIDGLVRKSFQQCIETLSERFNLEPGLLRSQFECHYRQLAPANQVPFPGAKDVCAYILGQGGLNVIVSQHSITSTRKLLIVHKFDNLFAGIFSLDQNGACKPSRNFYGDIIQEYGLAQNSILLVSSRESDIQTGFEAGLHTCLFGRVKPPGPLDYSVESHIQLLALLQSMNG